MSIVRNVYHILSWLSTPIVSCYLQWRTSKGKEDKTRLKERKGIPSLPRPEKSLVWIHAVSVGESMVGLALAKALLKHHPHLHILLTTMTLSSSKIIAQRLPRNMIHQFCPVDTPQAVSRFLKHWKPDLAIWIEAELWPNLMYITQEQGIPSLLINGRLSRKSFTYWKKFKGIISVILSRLDLCAVQSEEQAHYFQALGANNISIMGNAKLMIDTLTVDTQLYTFLKRAIRERPVWVAASSHPGEEEFILKAHETLKNDYPDLLTIIVPRHIERSVSLQEFASKEGLAAALHTEQKSFDNIEVYIWDKLGELATLYALSPVVLMGATFVPKGGHNPIEAAQLGAFVLHGPHTFNNPQLYDILSSLGLSEKIQDAHHIARFVYPWLKKQKLTYAEPMALKAYRKDKVSHVLDLLSPYLRTLREDNQ